MARTLPARLGYLLARRAFATLRVKLDPRAVNGGVFLGLNGIVIKSHGGANADGFASAPRRRLRMVRNGLLARSVKTSSFIGRRSRRRRPAAAEAACDGVANTCSALAATCRSGS